MKLSPGTSLAKNIPANPGEDLAPESSIESIRAWGFRLTIKAACKQFGGVGVSSVYSASPVTWKIVIYQQNHKAISLDKKKPTIGIKQKTKKNKE